MTRRVVDLERVRRALARLDELAKRPELQTDAARARLAEWMSAGGPDRPLSVEEPERMAPMNTTLQVRIATETVARLERLAVAMKDSPTARAAGRFTLAMAARLAIEEGLAVLESRLQPAPEK